MEISLGLKKGKFFLRYFHSYFISNFEWIQFLWALCQNLFKLIQTEKKGIWCVLVWTIFNIINLPIEKYYLAFQTCIRMIKTSDFYWNRKCEFNKQHIGVDGFASILAEMFTFLTFCLPLLSLTLDFLNIFYWMVLTSRLAKFCLKMLPMRSCRIRHKFFEAFIFEVTHRIFKNFQFLKELLSLLYFFVLWDKLSA